MSFTKNLIQSLLSTNNISAQNNIHLQEALNWLSLAQIMTHDDGVSEGFHLYHGWLPSYHETTGYIIETFFKSSEKFNDPVLKESGIKMASWLLTIQNSDGSIPDASFSRKMVFDTGQVIFGFIQTFKITGKKKYQKAAIKAGEWLLDVQEKDGSWIRYAAGNVAHTYYSRVAWSLLYLYDATSNNIFLDGCVKNIEWCLKQQQNNGWFNHASFTPQSIHRPFTHTIAYTIRGIFEVGKYLNEPKYINAAVKAMDHILEKVKSNGFVPGTFDKDWKGGKNFSCLTGNAQLAIIFFKLGILLNKESYLSAGIRINDYLKSKHNISSKNLNIRGAIAGSYPIWGKYIHFNYPNWATKFFVDSLLMEEQCHAKK